MNLRKWFDTRQYFLLSALILSACGGGEFGRPGGAPVTGSADAHSIPDARARAEPKSRYGNPASYVVFGKRYEVMNDSKGFVERGIASWYGKKFHGRRTSSGDTYDMYGMTAAHKHLPLPTYVEVKNLENGRKVIVRVNDRGPFHADRIIDLSYAAAAKLDIIGAGTGSVEIRALDPHAHRQDRGASPVPVAAGRAGVFIQVGAFSSYANALVLKNRLDGLNRNIRIAEVQVNNNRLYRVQLGPLENAAVLEKIVSELKRYGVDGHRIVMD